MHLETEEKNTRCLNLKVVNSEETRGKRAAKRDAQQQSEPQLWWFRCLWEQSLVRMHLVILRYFRRKRISTLGILLNFPLHFLRAVKKVRRETTTQTSMNHSFGDCSKLSEKNIPFRAHSPAHPGLSDVVCTTGVTNRARFVAEMWVSTKERSTRTLKPPWQVSYLHHIETVSVTFLVESNFMESSICFSITSATKETAPLSLMNAMQIEPSIFGNMRNRRDSPHTQ